MPRSIGSNHGWTNMITVFGEGRGFRVVWLLEEMGLTYSLRDVDLLALEADRLTQP